MNIVAMLSQNVTFNWAEANTSVALCAATYCNPKSLKDHKFQYYAEGFNITHLISDPKYDVNGYLGNLFYFTSCHITSLLLNVIFFYF